MQHNQMVRDIADAVSDFGFGFEVFKVIAHAVMAKGGNMQHLRRIVKEPALQRSIADLIVPTRSEVECLLGDGECLVPVSYTMPHDKSVLESDFSKDGVSELFYAGFKWMNHLSCIEIDQHPGECVMRVIRFNRAITSQDAIAEMDKLGYRPATHLEEYAFSKSCPDEPLSQFWIVALGSFAWHDTVRAVAVLDRVRGSRTLDYFWFDVQWPSGTGFLCVRRQTSDPPLAKGGMNP